MVLLSIIAVPPSNVRIPSRPLEIVNRFIVIPVPLTSMVARVASGPSITAVPWPSRVILWTSSGITRFSLQTPLTRRVSPGFSSWRASPMVFSLPHVSLCGSAFPTDGRSQRNAMSIATNPLIALIFSITNSPPSLAQIALCLPRVVGGGSRGVLQRGSQPNIQGWARQKWVEISAKNLLTVLDLLGELLGLSLVDRIVRKPDRKLLNGLEFISGGLVLPHTHKSPGQFQMV